MEKITNIEIKEHEKSNRILNIKLNDKIINKLLIKFNEFDITALELKPFTRFTIAKILDDRTENRLSSLLNKTIKVKEDIL